MVIVFLDIETTGLDYRVDSIISIQLKVGNNPPEILPSWESSEIAIIRTLIARLQALQEKEFTVCVGFNTLTFDIPFIVSRCIHLELLFPSEAFKIFYNNPTYFIINIYGSCFTVVLMSCYFPSEKNLLIFFPIN